MKIIALQVGSLGTNCYLAYDEQTLDGVVVDPGGEGARIIREIANHQIKVLAILLTHGHADHIMALKQVREALQAPVIIHPADEAMLGDAKRNLSLFVGEAITCAAVERVVSDEETVTIGSLSFKVLHTPGHTPGGCCFQFASDVFCGDTIFSESIGRTDLPGGSYAQLLQSIQEKIMTLPDETSLYPGHGPKTTVGWERRMNPFLA